VDQGAQAVAPGAEKPRQVDGPVSRGALKQGEGCLEYARGCDGLRRSVWEKAHKLPPLICLTSLREYGLGFPTFAPVVCRPAAGGR